MVLLTKTKFMYGLRCKKLLWLHFNKPESIPPLSLEGEFNTKQGNEIGILATKVFSDGIDIANLSNVESVKKTEESKFQRKPMFEATVETDGCLAKADILNPVNKDEWDIIEVKSGTKVEDHHIPDVAFQKLCFENAGYKIRNCYLMHPNKEYIKSGELNLTQLFAQDEINEKVASYFPSVQPEIQAQLNVIKSEMPNIQIHEGCIKNFKKQQICNLKNDCWSFLPEENVMEIYYNKKIGFELLQKDITQIKDIPSDVKIKGRPKQQAIQVACSKENKIHLDKESLKEFLDTLEYPYLYFDFETYAPAIPIYDGTHAHQKIPFQYSLHIEQKNGSVEHTSFLAKTQDDPRETLIEQLVKELGTKGSIVVYHKSFEIERFKELAKEFPKYSELILENWIPRVVDLEDPFSKFYYYNPKQKGKSSIKNVLPVLTDISYEGMEISKGTDAYIKFARVIFSSVSEEEKNHVLEKLEEYCTQDTWAEVLLIKALKKLC